MRRNYPSKQMQEHVEWEWEAWLKSEEKGMEDEVSNY
jgi:hypothetical protein